MKFTFPRIGVEEFHGKLLQPSSNYSRQLSLLLPSIDACEFSHCAFMSTVNANDLNK